MVWLSALLPYEQAAEVFARIGHQLIPRMSLWRQVQRHGERLSVKWSQQQGQTISTLGGQSRTASGELAQGMSLDGGMIHLRGEGWKEFKVGTIFEVVSGWAVSADNAAGEQQVKGVNLRYTAVLGSAEQFAPQMWALALQGGALSAARLSITADGAAGIWQWVADYSPGEVEIVDWYHALSHLTLAAQALYPQDEQRATAWLAARQEDLFNGHIDRIIQRLDEAFLSDHAHYFDTHYRRMQYAAFCQQDYPIGSGTVESGIKQFKARLTEAGMRWSRPAAEKMLLIRALVLGDQFDDFWLAA